MECKSKNCTGTSMLLGIHEERLNYQQSNINDLSTKLLDIDSRVDELENNTGGSSSFVFDSSIVPTADGAYDIGSSAYRIRKIYLEDDNSIEFENGSLGVSGGELTFNGTPVGGGTGLAHEVKPVIDTVTDPAPVNQGELWTATLSTVGNDLTPLGWSFYNYTGPGAFNRASASGTVGGIENTPGNYTLKARAGWAFGMSDEVTLNIIINAFVLSRDTLFGDVSGLQAYFSIGGNTADNYIALVGAVVDDSGTYTFDTTGAIQAESANCLSFYSYTEDRLVAFRINSSGTVESVRSWSSATTLPSQGMILSSAGSNYLTVSSQLTAALSSSVNGRRNPCTAYYNGGFHSTHYLSITPSGTELNNFGARGSSWSYGFRLADDWLSNGVGCQMLSPAGAGYFVNALAAFGIGSSPYEYVIYGDVVSGPYTTSTNTASPGLNISSTNWKFGSVGDMVIVTYGSGSGLWTVYVEGVQIFQSGNVDTYMSNTTTVTEVRLGDAGGSNQGASPSTYDDLGGWYARIDSIFIANGTEFDQTQVTEITSQKADPTLSTNYGSFTTFATLDGSGVTSVKGGAAYSRGDIVYA